MEFAQPPPNMGAPPPNMHMPPPNLSEPPPNLLMPPPNLNTLGNPMGPPSNSYNQRMDYKQFNSPRHHFRPFLNLARPLPGPLGNMTLEDFDGKRLRKSVMRKTVDYNSSIIKALENRVWQRDFRDRRALQPDVMYYPDMMPPPSYPDNPINCVTTRFVKTATNKMRCPIFCMAWTPEGRRLVTGASSGEFTLWNGLTFNFETILQAHDSPVRTMVWSHNDSWMVTGDHAGYVKYWQSNMNNVKMFQAHKEALRGISFSPTDSKFVTCSDDGTLRIWDFFRYQEERILRGHGADVKCVHWHPQKGLIISGSKDNQQPIKLWDPKTGQSLATLHAHKSTVMDLKWNDNGNWLITASRDHLLKLFDLRNLSQEVQTFRGHKKEASSVAWHPHHEGLFCSGGSDGSIMFWHVGADKEVGAIEQAHDSIVWTLAWHPLGHILCSGSNDHTSKFWTRNRPGDQMRDKYNLNTLPPGVTGLDDVDIDEPSVIPGMGPEDKVEPLILSDGNMEIPGLDLDAVVNSNEEKAKAKKVPYSKPIPRNFQAQWNETGDEESALSEVISQIVENTPGVVPLQKITPNAIIVYGKLIPVEPGSKLEAAIAEGPDALQKFIESGQIEELHDVMPHDDEHDYLNDAYMDDDEEEEHAAALEKQQQVNNKPEPPSAWDRPKSVEPEKRVPFSSDSRGMDIDSRSRHDIESRSRLDVDSRSRHDVDSRSRQDVDSRSRLDVDSRGRQDVDSRSRQDVDSRSRQDVDFRNPADYPPYSSSDEYRNTRYEEESEDDYEYQDRNFQRERNGNFNNQFNRNGGSSFNNNFRGSNNFNNRSDYRPDSSNRGPSSNDNFRSRGNRPPPSRPQQRSSSNPGTRGRTLPHRARGSAPAQSSRNSGGSSSSSSGSSSNTRGQSNRGRMY